MVGGSNSNYIMIPAMLLVLVVFSTCGHLGTSHASVVTDSITREATKPNDKWNRPLPLAAHWNTGWVGDGFTPDYQMKMIEAGHYILPSFYLPDPWDKRSMSRLSYYEAAIRKAAELRLPVCFVSTQWEKDLTAQPEFYNLPKERNPNVIEDDKPLKMVSPFGPQEPWREVGSKWTSNQLVRQLQSWYPRPPLVMFLSNNEHKKLSWTEVERSSRYRSIYGPGKADNFKRRVVGEGWIKLYRSLQQGMRSGLSSAWSEGAIFVGYNAFGPSAFGRFPGWIDYSLYIPGRVDPWPLAWDGASLSYYVSNSSPITDFTVMSPQLEAMNWVFMENAAWALNRNFWIELSSWDGHAPGKSNDKRRYYAALGQKYTPDRYEGYVQFGMWLLRPRTVREFRDTEATLVVDEPYFLSIVRAVDRVHNEPVLTRFWRRGTLVLNGNGSHPYQKQIPAELKNVKRWFLLDTSPGPIPPLTLRRPIPVFSIALVVGEAPNREWLVYSFSPLDSYFGVTVTVPGLGEITQNVSPAGTFSHVTERDRSNPRTIAGSGG